MKCVRRSARSEGPRAKLEAYHFDLAQAVLTLYNEESDSSQASVFSGLASTYEQKGH